MRLLLGADIEIFTKDRESSAEALMVFWFCLIHSRVQAKAEGMSFSRDSVCLESVGVGRIGDGGGD